MRHAVRTAARQRRRPDAGLAYGGEVSRHYLSNAGKQAISFRLDVRRLDDRPPLLDLGLLLGGERRWRLLLARQESLAQVGEPLAYRRIGQGLHKGDMKAGDDMLRCGCACPKPVPERRVQP